MESHVCTAGVHIFDSNNTVTVDKLMLQDGRGKIGGWEVEDWGWEVLTTDLTILQ
jgi:hypothetical protein